MNTIILASNRRVDITLSNAGQKSLQSVREYPFNAADSLALLDTAENQQARKSSGEKEGIHEEVIAGESRQCGPSSSAGHGSPVAGAA